MPDRFIIAGLHALRKRRAYWDREHKAAIAARNVEREAQSLQQLQRHDWLIDLLRQDEELPKDL
jgi:hypothetical protein